MAAGRRNLGSNMSEDSNLSINDPNRELFEACRNGDISKVKKIVNSNNVNAKDTAGRKSSPLHFAAGLSSTYVRRAAKYLFNAKLNRNVSQLRHFLGFSGSKHVCFIKRRKRVLMNFFHLSSFCVNSVIFINPASL